MVKNLKEGMSPLFAANMIMRRGRKKNNPAPVKIDHVDGPNNETPNSNKQPQQKRTWREKWQSQINIGKNEIQSGKQLYKDGSNDRDQGKKLINQGLDKGNSGIKTWAKGHLRKLVSPITAVFTKEELEMKNFIQRVLEEHTEMMNSSEDGSVNMVPLVQAAMNGDPATTQAMFRDAMKEKLAVAVDAYKQAAVQDIFNEPSDLDADDYEDEEALAEDFGPEDEDEYPEDYPQDDDIEFDDEEYEGDDSDDEELA